jgi:DNA repair exonuclease SbcCD ATPase subunit
MLRSIELRNFQAWAHLKLPLSPVTVIIGETNAGKSSILRGLSCVLFNSMEGQAMVKSGANLTEVVVATDDGHEVTWSRGNNVNRYTLNGQLYDKPGRSVPTPVQEALRIHELEFDGETVRLQWAPQMDAPFLLADSGAKATRMMGVAGNAAVVADAARLSQQEARSQQDALRSASTQRTQLAGLLEGFADVAIAEPVASDLRHRLGELERAQQKRGELEAAQRLYESLAPERARVTARQAAAHALTEALTQWRELHLRRSSLEAGAEIAARSRVMDERLATAKALLETWGQRARLEEVRDLCRVYMQVSSGVQVVRQRLVRSEEGRDAAKAAYDEVVLALTCPTCGRIEEAA